MSPQIGTGGPGTLDSETPNNVKKPRAAGDLESIRGKTSVKRVKSVPSMKSVASYSSLSSFEDDPNVATIHYIMPNYGMRNTCHQRPGRGLTSTLSTREDNLIKSETTTPAPSINQQSLPSTPRMDGPPRTPPTTYGPPPRPPRRMSPLPALTSPRLCSSPTSTSTSATSLQELTTPGSETHPSPSFSVGSPQPPPGRSPLSKSAMGTGTEIGTAYRAHLERGVFLFLPSPRCRSTGTGPLSISSPSIEESQEPMSYSVLPWTKGQRKPLGLSRTQNQNCADTIPTSGRKRLQSKSPSPAPTLEWNGAEPPTPSPTLSTRQRIAKAVQVVRR